MKIYLLILAVAVLSQCKFRHLSNLTIQAASPPLIKSLTPYELAVQVQDTVTTLNISNKTPLQTITIPPQSTIQLLPSQSLLLYINQNTIYQTHPTSSEYDLAFTAKDEDWTAPISSFGSKLAAVTYGDKTQIKIVGPNPWDSKTLVLDNGDGIDGGSGVNFISEKQFYFAAGGVCDGEEGSIYLHKSDGNTINKVYDFPLRSCSFDTDNQEWTLSSYQIGTNNYHLLTYPSHSDQPRRFTSQLVSNSNGVLADVVHFDIDRLIGATVASDSVIYTADNLLCRVLEHDILNHEHEHLKTYFATKPKRIFVTPSEDYVVTIAPYYQSNYLSAIVQKVQQDNTLSDGASYAVSTITNVVRGEILSDFYVIFFDDSPESILSIWDIKLPPSHYTPNIKGVVDFCVSNLNVVFILTNDQGQQTLGAYQMVLNVFKLVSSSTLLGTFQSLNCLDDNNVLLTPTKAGDSFYVWQFLDTGLTQVSNYPKDANLHATFNYANDILIFTNANSDTATFYDYKFAPKALSFNLPPNSVFKIVQTRRAGILLAVGSQIASYSSLQYYTVANSVIIYTGTFPYLDDGVADLEKTILFTSRGILHIEYEEGSTEWSTYFDLASPPLISYGYFFDETDKDCSQYDDAIFRITSTAKELIVLNKNGKDYPILEKYAITNKLTKTESYPLSQYSFSHASLTLSSNANEVIISGINPINFNYKLEVRNLNLLSTIIFAKEQHSSLNGNSLKSVDIVNGLVASLYSNSKEEEDTQHLNIYFRANTQNQIALNNDLFSAITLISTCPDCNLFAFTGTLKVVTDPPTVVVEDFTNPSIVSVITTTCQPDLLAFAPGGTKLAWKCPTKDIFVYDIGAKTSTTVTATYNTISELSFLDADTLLANLDGTIQRLTIAPAKRSKVSAGLLASYAIDYTRGIYAEAVNASTITIKSISTNDLLDTFTINNNLDISSLSFSSNGDLLVSNSQGTIIILTQAPCPIDKNLIDSFCICKSLYVQNGDQCTCNYVLQDSGSCVCDDGYYFDGSSNCNSCSAMCSTCSSDGAFDCSDYSVWFFLIIIGIILLVGAVVLVVVFKLKKKKSKDDTMYTEEKTKMSEPFVSQKEKSISEEIMRKSVGKD